jgi:UDP-glucose 4-epimerase
MKKVLILGSNGFVAKHLINLLEHKSYEYMTLGKMNLDLTNFQQCRDILSKIDLNDFTIIFLSALRPSVGEDLDITIKSLSMIRNLVVNIDTKILKQFIYVSSDGVYPYSDKILTEKSETNPGSFYGNMHLLREKFLQNIISADKLTIFRPCAIYGSKETIFSYGINKFVRDANNENKIYLFGKGEEKRDHILINDFVELILHSFEKNITGLFNVATGESKTFLDIANQINSILERKVKIVYLPRKIKISHRKFNINKLKKDFKLIRLKSINEGLIDLLKSR